MNIDNVKNFYRQKNKQFLRFILICVERAKRPESRIHDYAELYNGIGDEMKWEVEHIFSLHSFDEVFSDPRIREHQKNNLGNLTLISRDLNNNKDYKYALFDGKKELIKYFEENKFYINKVFGSKADGEEEYENLLMDRSRQLKEDFKSLFMLNGNRNFKLFFKEVLQLSC